MCGICGFLSFDQRIDEATLGRMNASIHRRGPDGAGSYFDGTVGLAMRRLAIIDLGGGQQPIFNEDRTACVVFNGEIYNYRELRQTLISKGHRFATHSDTEVIVHLYEEYGNDLAQHLQGMFAIALWDMRKRSLLLARDRLGIKPLFIAQIAGGFLFGSEIKALLATERIGSDLDLQGLDEYLTYTNVPCPRTIYKDIRQVEPGTTLSISAQGEIRQRRYWSLPAQVESSRSEAEWITDCEQGFCQAIESHLVSDVPVGAFLSGGVDSGLMVAMMAGMTDHPVETFTVGFKDAGSAFIDERQYARDLARRYKLNYHELDITPRLEDIVWEIVDAFDQPFADDSVVPSYYVSQAAGQHVKVAMTGLGGDELFGGYRRHLGLVLGERYARIPRLIRERLVQPFVERLPESRNSSDLIDHLKRFIRSAGAPAQQRYQDSMATLSWAQRQALYAPDIASNISPYASEQVIVGPFMSSSVTSILEQALRADLQTYLVDDILTLTDRLSMWHSLELRVPYLDHRFVEIAAGIPAQFKIRGSTQKYLLKKLAERWLPRDMIYHKKQGFEAPMGRWLRGPLLPFFDSIVNRKSIEASGIFCHEEVMRLRNEHVSLKKKHSKILFSILSFMLWQQRSAGRSVDFAPSARAQAV